MGDIEDETVVDEEEIIDFEALHEHHEYLVDMASSEDELTKDLEAIIPEVILEGLLLYTGCLLTCHYYAFFLYNHSCILY